MTDLKKGTVVLYDPEALVALANIHRHRDMVRLQLQKLIHELERRALVHDLSKLSPDEVKGFLEINKNARDHAYGTPEYDAALAKAKGPGGCIALHFSRNSHHPEFHGHEKEMGFLDIIEMVLDWKAASDTYGTNTLREAMRVNEDRFDFDRDQWWLIWEVVEWLEPFAHPA